MWAFIVSPREKMTLPFSVSREENHQNGANLSHIDHPASEIDALSIPTFLLAALPAMSGQVTVQ